MQKVEFTYSQPHTELIIETLQNLKGVFCYATGSEFKEVKLEIRKDSDVVKSTLAWNSADLNSGFGSL